MGLIALQRRLCLVKLCLISTRIDLGEQIAFLDRLALAEVNADQGPGDLAVDRGCIESRDGAEAGQYDRHVVLLDGGRDNRYRLDCRRVDRMLAVGPRIDDNSNHQGCNGCTGKPETALRPPATHRFTPSAQ